MADIFKVGDWVVNDYTGNVGYVLEVFNFSINVEFVVNRHGLRIDKPFTANLGPERFTPLPPEPLMFHDDILDIALLTKDIDWCEELQKLKGEKAK